MSNKKFEVGNKVKYIGEDHEENPEFYPVIGTVGLIKRYEGLDEYLIEWEKGSTSYNDCWYCGGKDLMIADEKKETNSLENIRMTNEEIWEMLSPKMEKNGLNGLYMGEIPYSFHLDSNLIKWYKEEDVHNAIAIAYRSGYERAMKGRPFKIGEKKNKGGHWEPINPSKLPEEGTRVRYARESPMYKNRPSFITLGETGTFARGKYSGNPGMKPDGNLFCPWVNFVSSVSCLDMWVEDDE